MALADSASGRRAPGAAGPRIGRCRGVVWRRLGGDLLVLGAGPASALRVRAPGALIWDLLGRPATIERLVAELVELTGGTAAEIAPDVEELVAALRAARVLEERP